MRLSRCGRFVPLSIALGLVIAPSLGAAGPGPVRAFVGARLWDGSGRPAVDGAVLLVQDGRVLAAGAGVAVPKGAERVDLAGRYVIPGLVNAHGHVGETRGLRSGPDLYSRENVLEQLALYARYGVTTVVSLGGDQAEGFRVRDEQDGPALARARLHVAGRIVDATTPAAAREQVAALAAQKPDWVKIRVDDVLGTTPRMAPEVYRAVIDEAHARGLRVAAHLFYLEDARGLLDAGVDFIAHSVRDRDVPADFAAALKARGIPFCPTLMREVSTFVYGDEPAFFSDPFFLKDADPAVVAELRSPARREPMRSSPAAARYREALVVASRNLKALADAGVAIVMGTDSGPPARFQGYFEHEELRLMVEAGLTPAQALFAATGGAARALGLADVGRLEPGAWADFLVLTADPLADIRNTRRIESVFVAGNRVPARTVGGVMDEVAPAYVKLVLALGVHDADFVDAYYGPPEWRTAAQTEKRPLDAIRGDAERLLARLRTLPPVSKDEAAALRHEYLTRQLQALVARVNMLAGTKLLFDAESRALYDAVAPEVPEAHFRQVQARLETLLPGSGSLVDRYEAYRKKFVIAPERLSAVFDAAIAECRRRTLPHVDLPAGEMFTVEYVRDKSWSAYNWYQGGFRSVIQVNQDLPITIERAVDLACHEGYPGHHVYNALLEKHLVQERGWVEFSVYPLFSPQSLIAEGTANYGIEVAFPGDERTAFERAILYPLAGLDPSTADAYARVQREMHGLDYGSNEAARRYLEGRIDAAGAAQWLTTFALMPPDRARQRVRFIDQYRAYVLNYNLGQDLVRAYVEKQAKEPGDRWPAFKALLASPRLPGGLQ